MPYVLQIHYSLLHLLKYPFYRFPPFLIFLTVSWTVILAIILILSCKVQRNLPVYSYLSFWDWFAHQPVWWALLWQELGSKVFRAKHKRGFFGVKALDTQTNFLVHCMYPDFPVFPTNLYMPINVLEDYFALQILQKLLPASWRTLVQWLGVELNTKRMCCWAMLQN